MDTADIIKRIRKIEITTKDLVNQMFAGEYHSLFKGQGLEFSEVRRYQEGDSFKQIDWNVSARMGEPYIKKFEETRELNVLFVVDMSASTVFGTRNQLKSEYLAEVTAVLGFSALSNNDKVGLLLFSDRIEKYVPPRKGRNSALRILRDILYTEPKGTGTNLSEALTYLNRLLKKRSIVFILSDFDDSAYDTPLRLLAKKHDLVALRVLDKAEIDLPDAGLVYMYDPETGEQLAVNTSNKRLRQRYKVIAQAKEEELRERFKKMRLDLVTLTTDQPYASELQKFFKLRLKRKRHG